jgi:hypothetical protein
MGLLRVAVKVMARLYRITQDATRSNEITHFSFWIQHIDNEPYKNEMLAAG